VPSGRLPLPESDPASTCGSLKGEEPAFEKRSPIYHAYQFPNATGFTEGPVACRVDGRFPNPWMWDFPLPEVQDAGGNRRLQRFSEEYFERQCLPQYETLLDCLTCCAGGCQLHEGYVVGRQCTVKNSTLSAQPSSNFTAYPYDPEPEEEWANGILDGGGVCPAHGQAACSITDSLNRWSAPDSNSTCSGFESPRECMLCCDMCRPQQNANVTFEGRGCVEEQTFSSRAIVGRPFTDGDTGRPVLATLTTAGPSWVERQAPPLSAERDSAAAEAWEQAALGEHASVASFSRHLLDLLAIGSAPPHILEQVATAAADEVRHAAQSLAVASLLRGSSSPQVSPGPLPMPAHQPLPSLADLAAAVLDEGCVEETVSAALAIAGHHHSGRDRGSQPEALAAARETVMAIAREEAAHAQLAWSTLAWVAERDSSVLAVVEERLGSLRRQVRRGGESEAPEGVAPWYGIVTRAGEKQRVREAVVRRLVVPALEALLEGRSLVPRATAKEERGAAMQAVIASALRLVDPPPGGHLGMRSS